MGSVDLDMILAELRAGLPRILGDQLAGVYLYGSYARNEATPDSDIDILVVLNGEFDYFEMLWKISFLTAEVSLNHDVVVSTVLASVQDFENLRTPFMINVRKDCITI